MKTHPTYPDLYWMRLFPLSKSISGVLSIPLSVVLGVEEDQSEGAPAHAWHEGGAHHPALRAHQADEENDRRDNCMSTTAAKKKRNIEEENLLKL